MPKKISANFSPKSSFVCASCGSEYELGSAFESFRMDICGNCHPAYTGKAILIDTAGQLKKFQDRMAMATNTSAAALKSKKVKARKARQGFMDLDQNAA
ncbi:MAG: hypothetical protein OHK0017_02400 [Patescibacteria group bacterium]